MDQWPEQAAVSEVLFPLQRHLSRSWLEKGAVTDESWGVVCLCWESQDCSRQVIDKYEPLFQTSNRQV